MRVPLAMIVLAGLAGPALAECPVGEIEKALAAPLDGLKMTERPATDIQSTEGGVWRIYRGADEKVETLIRLDGGESGMNEYRLSIVSAGAYGISAMRVDYLRHAFVDNGGPNGTARRSTSFYYYCNGQLFLPPPEFGTAALAGYPEEAAANQKRMLLDKDVADLVKDLKR